MRATQKQVYFLDQMMEIYFSSSKSSETTGLILTDTLVRGAHLNSSLKPIKMAFYLFLTNFFKYF